MTQPFSQTLAQLRTTIQFRTQDVELGDAQEKWWENADVNSAIASAVRAAAPLGIIDVIEMSDEQYSAATQPAQAFYKLTRVQVRHAVYGMLDVPSTHFRFQPNQARWLELHHGNGDLDVVVTGIEPYVVPSEDAHVVVADTEMIVEYALAILFETLRAHGQLSDRQLEATAAQTHRMNGDMRKAVEMARLYPELEPQKDSGSSKRRK